MHLLVNTLKLGSHFDAEEAESMYTWTLPIWTTDTILRQLLQCLPPDDPGVRAAGSVTVTERTRLNPPEPAATGIRAYLGRFCNIL